MTPVIKKILVLDDEPDILRLIKAALNKYNHKVDAFSEGLAALQHFRQHHDEYSLLLVDVRMPGMNGLEFAKVTRSVDPDVKIVLMTAFELNKFDLQQNMPFVKIDDLLIKPFLPSKICEIINKHIVEVKE